MLPNPEIREVTLQDYFRIIQKRAGIIIAFLVILPLAVMIFDFTRKPIYRATTSLSIERNLPKIVRFEDSYTDLGSREYFETQIRVLTSRAMAEKAFDELKLIKEPDYQKISDPISKLQDQIKIEKVRDSNIFMLHVEDYDALKASIIANTIAKIFIQQDIESRNRQAKESLGWLENQAEDIKKNMQNSEEQLNDYIQKNRIVTVPDIEKKTETLLQNLKQEKSKVETERADALKRYKEKHPKMISLNAQIDDLGKKIEQETNNLLDLNQKMVQYNILKKDVDSNQQLYTILLARAKETNVTEKIEKSMINIIDPAQPPSKPYKPNKKKDLGLSIILALFMSTALSFFLEYLDSTIRTAEDVSSYLALPFLGYIPSIGKEAKTDAERALICYQNTKSAIAEAFRAVRTSLLFASPEDKPLKVIMATSALPEEGKSFFISNLSQIFCQMNEKIILIDMDMRRPKINKCFNLDLKNGLSDFLAGKLGSETVIKTTSIPHLSVITAGTISPNPSELLSSNKLKSLLEELKTKFDRVIIDAPPILSVADASILVNIVDGVVMVIKGGATRLEAVVRAKQKILEAKGKITGVVVNNIEPEKEDKYYYYHYYYTEEEGKTKGKK